MIKSSPYSIFAGLLIAFINRTRLTPKQTFRIVQSTRLAMTNWCPLLAQSGHTELHCTCPLSGVKRTCRFALQMSAFDAVDGAPSAGIKSAIGWLREARATRR